LSICIFISEHCITRRNSVTSLLATHRSLFTSVLCTRLVMQWKWCLVKLLSVCLSLAVSSAEHCDGGTHAGHLQPFGSSGPFRRVDVVHSFPSTVEFFQQYVRPLRPLKMTGAARLSSAFHKWTDDYFLQTAVSVNSSVAVETSKKENRTSPLQYLHFHAFLRLYNSTDHYMVDNIPQEFR